MMINSYFDEEAAEESDNEEVERRYTEEEIHRENMSETALQIMQQQDRRRQAEAFALQNFSAEEIARRFEERHQGQTTAQSAAQDAIFNTSEDEDEESATARSSLRSILPAPPNGQQKLWVVSCSKGRAPRLVQQIRNKCDSLGLDADATSRPTDKAHIYIESSTERAALEAVRGIRGIFLKTLKLIPGQTMQSVLATIPSQRNQSTIPSKGLFIGGVVRVTAGDLVGMQGRITDLDNDNNTVKIKPSTAGLGEVEVLANHLKKIVAVGAHVKVIDGPHENQTGLVVAVKDNEDKVVLFTDTTNKQVTVKTSHVRESTEVNNGPNVLQGHKLHDLVSLGATECGVIVRVGNEDFSVLNQHGMPRQVRPEEIRQDLVRVSKRAQAWDSQGNPLREGASIAVVQGRQKGMTGSISRMFRAYLFVFSQTRSENAGVFVVHSRSCLLAGAGKRSFGAAGGTRVGRMTKKPRRIQGGRPSDGLMGQTVCIRAGKYKGYLGSVCGGGPSPLQVQVELHSMPKKIYVTRDSVAPASQERMKFQPVQAADVDVPRPQTAPIHWDLDE